MLTKTNVATGGLKFVALLLAVLSVALEYRRRGIGSKLVLHSSDLAKKLGYKAIFVVGDPAYYIGLVLSRLHHIESSMRLCLFLMRT